MYWKGSFQVVQLYCLIWIFIVYTSPNFPKTSFLMAQPISIENSRLTYQYLSGLYPGKLTTIFSLNTQGPVVQKVTKLLANVMSKFLS